jgi:hypothetical protein
MEEIQNNQNTKDNEEYQVEFEKANIEQYNNLEVEDIVNFEEEEIDSVLDLLEDEYEKYFTLQGNMLIFQYEHYADTIIDDNLFGKKIVSVFASKFEGNYTYKELKETDVTTDLIGWNDDQDHTYSVETEKRLLKCIEKRNDCSYIDSYKLIVNITVDLVDV